MISLTSPKVSQSTVEYADVFECGLSILSCNQCHVCIRAMLGNPPVPPYGIDLNEEAAEVENYEVGVSSQ